ncbi:hypothetical protein D3C87_1318780 [compost metagenome]
MELIANIGHITMQLSEVIGKIETNVPAIVDGHIYFGFSEGGSSSFDAVDHLFLRPLQVFYGYPPAGGTARNKRYRGALASGQN